ncbi:hypothetical protein E4U11_003630 [Claviceps purpurea]|nr:hypothetical protein E4U11_003630 [Claviceps purpurea]
MRKTNDSNGAESRKRRRESVSNGEEGSDPARQEGHRVPSTAKRPALEPKHAKSTITARMPTKLLTTNWSVGSKRLLNRRNVQQLKRAFVQLGGPKRDLEEHHLKVLCTGAQVHRMMKQLGSQDGTKQAGGMPDFTIWPDVNGREQLELLAGQHRVRALEEWVKEADLGEEELWWPCKFYDKDGISAEQNMKLRLNRKDVAHPDSHGDIWLQVVTAAAQKPEKFQGKACEITAEIVDTLELNLGSVVGRLVTLWRNEIWRKLVTQWCKTAVGRATFQIRAWSVMITCRIDDFWFSIFGQVLDTLAHLPGDAASYVTEEDWKQMSKCFEHGRSETQIRELFYPDRGSREVDQSCPRRADLLVLLDKEAYWQVYEHVVQREQTSFPHLHRILSLTDQDIKILRGVMNHVVDWLSEDRSKRRNKRDNNKPGLRVDMVAALQFFDEKKLQEAKGRVTTSIGELGGQSIAEAASIVIQQEVLDSPRD